MSIYWTGYSFVFWVVLNVLLRVSGAQVVKRKCSFFVTDRQQETFLLYMDLPWPKKTWHDSWGAPTDLLWYKTMTWVKGCPNWPFRCLDCTKKHLTQSQSGVTLTKWFLACPSSSLHQQTLSKLKAVFGTAERESERMCSAATVTAFVPQVVGWGTWLVVTTSVVAFF